MKNFSRQYLVAALTVFAAWPVCAAAAEDKGLQIFTDYIVPVLKQQCYECHSHEAGKAKGGLVLDSRSGWEKGGDSGPAIVPGKPEESLLLTAVLYHDEDYKMPPKQKLADEDIAHLRDWIALGAADPRESAMAPKGGTQIVAVTADELWSLQPLAEAGPDATVDGFLNAKLETAGLAMAPVAHPAQMLRRISYDLIGLPPQPEEVLAFVDAWHRGPEKAIEAKVDELLASPHFGERWGRHWLDVARFAESNGGDLDLSYNHAWRYRQYVIDALNADMPFDQFVTEQLAGDLLPAKSDADRLRQVSATGLLALGQKLMVDDKVVETADENLDVVSKSLLGLSVTCARCHDHKFDPIPQTDYYALSGILQNTEFLIGEMSKGPEPVALSENFHWISAGPPLDPQKLQKLIAEAEAISGKADAGKEKQISLETRNAILLELKLKRELEGQVPVIGVTDKPDPKDAHLLRGGDPKNEEAIVPRGFLSAVKLAEAPQVDPTQSGRLQLAQWVTNPENPLTARVAANRFWMHLFGKGLVSTPDNFGSTGQPPSHPELLDYLARRFVEGGWSHKKLIRELVLSRAYRSTSWAYSPTRQRELDAMAKAHEADPDNALFWRMNVKRLEVEALRDSVLAAAGQLDRTPAHRSIMEDYGTTSFSGNGRRGDPKPVEREQIHSRHRGVYLPLLRSMEPPMFSVFDFPRPVLTTGQRSVTSVPPQALFLMNNPWVNGQTIALAKSLLAHQGTDEERLAEAWLRVLSRTVRIDELANAQRDLVQLRSVQPALSEEKMWALVVHSLFLTTEFRDLY